jgi:carbamoyltransferase
MRILGVSSYHHDSAAASLNNRVILGASHEERFTRKKYDKSFPINTISWLKNTYEDWEFAAFYEESTYKQFKSDIKKLTSAEPVLVEHHKAHAMSSILTTDWDDCAVMVIDTVGGKFSTSLGVYENGEISWLKRFRYPNSLGLFYSSATRLLGFEPLSGESQVMAAAGYGIPKWSKLIKEKIIKFDDGDYTVLQNLERGVGFGVLDWDIAASVQAVFTDIIFSLTEWLFYETGKSNLAYSGGCALNCITNGHLSRYSSFDNIAIQPASGDAGASLGAAALLERPLWEGPYLGVEEESNVLPEEAAIKIINGYVVPVIHGRAEFGPRALGNRTLLCAPIDGTIEKLNNIKGRVDDSWRPYAPVVQDKEFNNFFKTNRPCPYMLFVADIKEESNFKTHNNTARVQCVDGSQTFLYNVLEVTRQYGYPILINTSLNAKGRPIVNKKEDLDEIRLHHRS